MRSLTLVHRLLLPALLLTLGACRTPSPEFQAEGAPPGEEPIPSVSLASGDEAFRESWTLVYVGDGRCDAHCREALTGMRQMERSLRDADLPRVRRVFLATGECCDQAYLDTEHPGLIVLDSSGPTPPPIVQQFPADGRTHTVFVVDGNGYLRGRYDAHRASRTRLSDLRNLLRRPAGSARNPAEAAPDTARP